MTVERGWRARPWRDEDVRHVVEGFVALGRSDATELRLMADRLGRSPGAVAWIERFAGRIIRYGEVPPRWRNRIERREVTAAQAECGT